MWSLSCLSPSTVLLGQFETFASPEAFARNPLLLFVVTGCLTRNLQDFLKRTPFHQKFSFNLSNLKQKSGMMEDASDSQSQKK